MKSAKVYLDGRLIGFHDNPVELVEKFKASRRKGKIDSLINVGYKEDTNEILINTSGGRIQRPLIVLKDGKPVMTKKHMDDVRSGKTTFDDLVKDGVIEYVDADEEDNILVATNQDKITSEHTHMEIDSAVLFSMITSMIPFLEHDLATKSLHGAKMFKQSIGYNASNNALKTDTDTYQLYYPQKHLVKTKTIDLLRVDERPIIQNMVVAIMPYYGFNMHDALVLNKGAVERGLSRLTYYKTYTDKESLYPGGQRDYFRVVDSESESHLGEDAYKIIGDDNLPEVETFVDRDTVLIAKASPPKFIEDTADFGLVEEKYEDRSSFVNKNKEGNIDKVYLTSDGEAKMIKVKVRASMSPENGDKFSSKHGQKGVVGIVANEADMPVSSRGIIPDLILNPHSIPSRQTIGDLLEMVGGKSASLNGQVVDGTPYSSESIESIKEVLKAYGFRSDGYELFYDGLSGRVIKGEIFTGISSYRRLFHLVSHKIQARARGPVQVLTRQPTEGKQKEGGLKFGEMESDCLVGYGAAMLLNEKLVEDSDKVRLPVCKDSGLVAIDDKITGKRYSLGYSNTEIVDVNMPYSFKLFLDELRAMAIYPRIILQDKI